LMLKSLDFLSQQNSAEFCIKIKVYLEKFGRDSLVYWLKFKVASLSLKIDVDFALRIFNFGLLWPSLHLIQFSIEKEVYLCLFFHLL
jgi:hypothetical protein